MKKLGKWHNTKKVLPNIQKTCLIQIGEYEYDIATLEALNDENGGYITFLTWSKHTKSYPLDDVERWAYICLD